MGSSKRTPQRSKQIVTLLHQLQLNITERASVDGLTPSSPQFITTTFQSP